jgi:hypothetical protein
MQQEALCTAVTDVIWKAGGSQYGVLCLPHPTHIHVEESDLFNADGKNSSFCIIVREYVASKPFFISLSTQE